MRFKSRLAKAITGLAVTSLLAMQAFAANGDLAGPSDPNKTVQNSVGQTFQYENANSGQGTFTMGTGDSSLTAEWDAIRYRVVFDGTYALGESITWTKGYYNKTYGIGSAAEQSDIRYNPDEVVAFAKLANLEMGGTDETFSGDYTLGMSQINIPYNLRYDQTYTLPKMNGIFFKSGYQFVGWQTKAPRDDAEMEQWATQLSNPVTSVDGTNSSRLGDFTTKEIKSDADNNYTKQDVTITQGRLNNTADLGTTLIKDGGQFKNLTWGDYTNNEIVTKGYKTVTLYAIWKLEQQSSKVYYTLQKADGTYQYDVNDSSVKLAKDSYIELNDEDFKKFEPSTSYSWSSGGDSWDNRTIKSNNRVYRYTGQSGGYHDTQYVAISAQTQILPGGTYQTDVVDMGYGIKISKDAKNIFIEVQRRKVTVNVYGALSINNQQGYMVDQLLKTSDRETTGTFSIQSPGASVWCNGGEYTKVLGQSDWATGLYGATITVYAGQNIKFADIIANSQPRYNTYEFKYKGYTFGNGTNVGNSIQTGPQSTQNNFTVSDIKENKYVILYFNQADKVLTPLNVVWNQMTRQYNDVYSDKPWSDVHWRQATVGTGQTSKLIYYMQVYLDNKAYGADTSDRLNIAGMPYASRGKVKLECHQYSNNVDFVAIRFYNGISEAELQDWLRNTFCVRTYTDPGNYNPADNRVHIYVSDNVYCCYNTTGADTNNVDDQYITYNNFYYPSDFSNGAWLVFGNDSHGTLYWKYRREVSGSIRTGPSGYVTVRGYGGKNYSDDRSKYGSATHYQSVDLQNILSGLDNRRITALDAGCSYTTAETQDNKLIAEIDGTTIVMVNANEYYSGSGSKTINKNWYNTNQASVEFKLWGGDCQSANTSEAWGETHGGSIYDMWVNWTYYGLKEEYRPVLFLDGVKTTVYTIPRQYPVVIQYDTTQAFGSDTAWTAEGNGTSNGRMNDIVMEFDPHWIYGRYEGWINGRYEVQNETYMPTQYKRSLQTGILKRYGYVWDGRWYSVYDTSKAQKKAYDWLSNRLNGVKAGSNYNSQNNNTSLLKYNTDFGAITNAWNGYGTFRYGDYGQFVDNPTVSRTFQNGYIEFTDNTTTGGSEAGTQAGTAQVLDYPSLIQLWIQSGAEYRNYNVNGTTRWCRVITLRAARTVPIQYTVKYVSGGVETFGNNQNVPYSWRIDDSKKSGSINNDASAVSAYKAIANSHALNEAASGVNVVDNFNSQSGLASNYGTWYRQQFVYDKADKLLDSAFSRPNDGLTIDNEKLSGYEFTGWTVYMDSDGNNDGASYRVSDAKNNDRKISSSFKQLSQTKTSATSNLTFGSGVAGSLASDNSTQKSVTATTKLLASTDTASGSETSQFFLGNKATVKNLLNAVQVGQTGIGTPNTVSGNIALPQVVYKDDFKWPEIVVYPNWRKTVSLNIVLDNSQTDADSRGYLKTDSNGKIIGEIGQSQTYGSDIIYNNQFYFPVQIIKTLQKDCNQFVTAGSWRGDPEDLTISTRPGATGSSIASDWATANGTNTRWIKSVLSTVKDGHGNQIRTYYRFLGLSFSPTATYPATSDLNSISGITRPSSMVMPDGAISNALNAKAFSGQTYYTHPRKYNLQTFDVPYGYERQFSGIGNNDIDHYNAVIDKYYTARTAKSDYAGSDTSGVYYNIIDCYNPGTTVYCVWEPILTTQIDITRTGYNTASIGGDYADRVTGVTKKVVTLKNSKAGVGVQTTISIDGTRPTPSGQSNALWQSQDSYKTSIEYRYNDNFTNEIVNLYKDPIASSKQYQTVLDKLNNSATFTSNQRTKDTVNGDKRVSTPQHYQNWQYYLPLYLGTDEMNKASGGAFIYGPDKVYGVTIFVQRYSFFYANYVPDSKKDAEYPNNETTIIEIDTTLKQASKPSHSTDPSPSPKPGTEPTPTPVPDPGHTPTPTPTPDPSLPKPTTPPHGNEGGNNDAETVLDDLRIHVKLH